MVRAMHVRPGRGAWSRGATGCGTRSAGAPWASSGAAATSCWTATSPSRRSRSAPLARPSRSALYQRTLREAKTAARLNHPGVVTVFDVVEEDGRPWIVMELVQARSLDQVIAEDGPLPVPGAAGIGRQLVSALATAHAAGVLHRDVKPSNVLLAPDGRAVLTDFGIATFEGDERLTQAGMVIGHARIHPARAHPRRARDPRVRPVVAGRHAVRGRRGPRPVPGARRRDHHHERGAARGRARGALGRPLGPVIAALMQKDPAARPDAVTASMLLAAAGGAGSPRHSGRTRREMAGLRRDRTPARAPARGPGPAPTPSWPAPDAVPTAPPAAPVVRHPGQRRPAALARQHG